MLRELPGKAQNDSGQRRRWFFCQQLDLVVWLDAQNKPVGFQLAYNKLRGECSISWHPSSGYRHYVVDNGPAMSGNTQTPLLHAAGGFPQGLVMKQFCEHSLELPLAITEFVEDKLAEYVPRSAMSASA